MVKPIISYLDAISCNEENTIPFTYSGNLIKKVKIKITTSSDIENVIYGEGDGTGVDKTQVRARSIYQLPADAIDVSEYGTRYYIQVKVIENDDSESLWSDPRLVTIITSPIFKFDNVEAEDTITHSYLDAILNYSQSENELLQSYQFYIYDNNHILLSSSDVLYDISSLSYRYNGLEDGIYYIRAKGSTVNGYDVDTDYIKIYVNFERPELYSNFYLTNNFSKGSVTYRTNILSIDYHGDAVFDYVDGFIDLTAQDLYYDKGFNIDSNATFIIKGKGFLQSNVKFFEAKNSTQSNSFYITAFIYDDNSIRFKLISTNGLNNYVLYSPACSITNEDLITFAIRKVNGLYDFKVYKNEVEVV